jgi:L-phenylalanine/L-methionine N-acetyltransferase
VMHTMSTPKAYGGTLQLPLPSLEHWRERMTKIDAQSCMIVAEAREPSSGDGAFGIVGHLGLFPTNGSNSMRRSHVMGLGMSVHDDWHGRGIGSALMKAALERADNWTNILRIELTVFVDNESALALYRRHGFVMEGTHHAYALRDGVYMDAYSMARLHPRQPQLPVVRSE